MADIYTHLRELGVAFFFFSKKSIEVITPAYFFEICSKNIEIHCDFNIKMIARNKNEFTTREKETIKNAEKLAEAIKNNFKISKNPKIIWVGCDTQSDSPIDLIIDDYKFSLKEESFIIENMGLYKLLNILLDTDKYSTGVHVFKEFAYKEFDSWFNTTCNCLLKVGPEKFRKNKPNKYNVLGYIDNYNICLEYSKDNKITLENIKNITYQEFEDITNSHLREYVFSKWIKEKVEDEEDYIRAKKYCAVKAGENLLKLVKNREKTSPKLLRRFFRIMDEEYYYAKTTNYSLEIYKVPFSKEAAENIIINSLDIDVPKSQLNFFTEIVNLKNGNNIVFRNELRYSHGQFNGTPEVKCYIKNGDLTTMYEKIV